MMYHKGMNSTRKKKDYVTPSYTNNTKRLVMASNQKKEGEASISETSYRNMIKILQSMDSAQHHRGVQERAHAQKSI